MSCSLPPKNNKTILILHAAPLKVTNYNTDTMLRKAEVWRRNKLTTGDRGLIQTNRETACTRMRIHCQSTWMFPSIFRCVHNYVKGD
jgi:hypothetical protein